MGLTQKIEQDYISALKTKEDLAVLTYRQLKTAIANAEISNNRQELSEDDILKIIKSEVKKRKESFELYQQGGRGELADKEQKEIEVLQKYLPAEISDEELGQLIKTAIANVGASGPADMGKVMGEAMKLVSGKADGTRVQKMVKQSLA